MYSTIFKERIGLDRTRITGFRIISIDFEKLKKHPNVTLDRDGKYLYLLNNGEGFRLLKIEDNHLFNTLRAGIIYRKKMKLTYATINITIGNNNKYGNLQNISVLDYKNRVHRIFNYLDKEYGILVSEQGAAINTMEINCTFQIKEPFHKYHRVLRLIMFNLPARYSKISSVSKKNSHKSRLEPETFYYGNKSMQIKIYDKQQQLLQTTGYDTQVPLMRIEFTLKTSRKIKEVFGSTLLSELTDAKLNNYFISQFHKLIEIPYRRWQSDNAVLIQSMMKQQKKKNRCQWQQNLLNEFRNHEQKYLVPLLLDISDLLQQVKAADKHRHYSKVSKSILAKCRTDDVYLQNDSAKMEEIISNVLSAYKNSISSDTLQSNNSLTYSAAA